MQTALSANADAMEARRGGCQSTSTHDTHSSESTLAARQGTNSLQDWNFIIPLRSWRWISLPHGYVNPGPGYPRRKAVRTRYLLLG